MLVFLRHGESTDNRDNIFSGRHDCPLSEDGVQQAREVRQELQAYRFDYVFTSPLVRASETARLVVENMSGMPDPVNLPVLMERAGGDFEGLPYTDLRSVLSPKQYKLWQRDYFEAPDMGESMKDVEDRVRSFVMDFLKPSHEQNQNILVVSHSVTIRTMLGLLMEWDEQDVIDFHLENAVPYVIE